MEPSLLVRALGETPELRVIDYLLENDISDFSIQGIAEGAGLSRNTVSKIVCELEKIGVIVHTRDVGRAKLFKINIASQFVKHLRKLDLEISKEYAHKVTAEQKVAVRA